MAPRPEKHEDYADVRPNFKFIVTNGIPQIFKLQFLTQIVMQK